MSVRLDRHDNGVAVLTFDDPERRNAMTEAMGIAIAERCAELASDEQLRAVVLTGAPPAFSAGGDLGMLESHARRTQQEGFDATDTMRSFYGSFLTIADLPVPVVAAINGHAIGAGLCIALACDLRVVAAEAKVGMNFSKLGLHPGMGGTWFLPRILGAQRAAEWLYAGGIVTGDVAARQGLALESLPTDEVLPRALAIADDIAASSPVVVRQLKGELTDVDRIDLDTALQREAEAQAVSFGTKDLVDGLAAIRARAVATFEGR